MRYITGWRVGIPCPAPRPSRRRATIAEVILGALVVAIWVFILAGRGGFWRMRVVLPPPLDGPLPSVVAVVPARNEADVVARAAASLVKQRYGGEFHVVLVDDHSTDGTAEAASQTGATVIPADPLLPGWTGKLSAVATGIRYAARFSPEYLLLTDADIEHPPDNLAGLVARAAGGYDLVSYMAMLHCGNTAERALIPAFVFFFFLLYPPSRGTGAAGGCMLVRRVTLERAGGIEAIRGRLIDDCSLAAAIRKAGGRVWLGLNPEVRSIRPYTGVAEIGRMISRSAFTQLRYSWMLLAGTVAGLLLTYVVPVVLGVRGSPWGIAAWILMTIAYLPAVRYYRVSPLWAPLLPAIAVFYMGATVHSAIAHARGKGGAWKGRDGPVQ
jgi:hopene-associated glycosyltransferase HpnB